MAISVQTRLKVSLKMTISKLQHTQQKQSALAKQQRRALADLLKAGKEESAKIRVENVIRDDIYVELCELLELYCELLLARISLLDAKTCDPGLEEAVKLVIYAAPHSECKELMTVRDILAVRFGQEFYKSAIANEDGIVPKKIVDRVCVQPPSSELVSLYLKEIARAYGVPFSELGGEAEVNDLVEDEPVTASEKDEKSQEKPLRPLDELEALKSRFSKLKGL